MSEQETWWAKGYGRGDIPPEAESIADDLPPAAQKAIMEGQPWALEIDRPARLQLELFGLLEEDGASLSDMGVYVLRTLIRWDVDYAERREKYDAWFNEFYAPAYCATAPQHRAAHAALFLHPDAHGALLDIAEKSRDGITVTHQPAFQMIEYLGLHALVRSMDVSRGKKPAIHIELTGLGRSAAQLLRLAKLKHEEIFEGAKQSATMADLDVRCCRLMAAATDMLARDMAA